MSLPLLFNLNINGWDIYIASVWFKVLSISLYNIYSKTDFVDIQREKKTDENSVTYMKEFYSIELLAVWVCTALFWEVDQVFFLHCLSVSWCTMLSSRLQLHYHSQTRTCVLEVFTVESPSTFLIDISINTLSTSQCSIEALWIVGPQSVDRWLSVDQCIWIIKNLVDSWLRCSWSIKCQLKVSMECQLSIDQGLFEGINQGCQSTLDCRYL